MTGPIHEARLQAKLSLQRAGLALDQPLEPALESIRFRADGKGGELASPYPMAAGLDPTQVAEQCLRSGWFESIRPSGGWIAFDLSEQWRDYVRARHPEFAPPDPVIPPIPEFPARIDEASWRFCTLLGQADPALAGRLDTGNPYRQLLRAQALAGQGAGKNRSDRYLVNLCAQCSDAKQLLALSAAYLAHPGEDDTVQKYIRGIRKNLGI